LLSVEYDDNVGEDQAPPFRVKSAPIGVIGAYA
jgi:hypothetical protein